MDIKNAFLHEELDGEIYMNRPNEFENEVGVISQYRQSPKKLHLDAAWRILRYDKGTINYDFLYKRSKDLKLARYRDVDYDGYHETWRSSTGYVFKLDSKTTSLCRKRQQTISLSTREVEYKATTRAA